MPIEDMSPKMKEIVQRNRKGSDPDTFTYEGLPVIGEQIGESSRSEVLIASSEPTPTIKANESQNPAEDR